MIGGYNPWFIDEVTRRARRRGADILGEMGQGLCPDYAGYQRMVGEVAGLEAALDIMEDIRKEQDSQ